MTLEEAMEIVEELQDELALSIDQRYAVERVLGYLEYCERLLDEAEGGGCVDTGTTSKSD